MAHPGVQPSGLHLIFNLPLSKLYTNSLMSSLNSRQGWQYDSSTGVSQNRAEQPKGLTRPRNVNVNMLRSENGRRVSLGARLIPSYDSALRHGFISLVISHSFYH